MYVCMYVCVCSRSYSYLESLGRRPGIVLTLHDLLAVTDCLARRVQLLLELGDPALSLPHERVQLVHLRQTVLPDSRVSNDESLC